jgi:predicted TIM-barrel fold metal-dependent hydrolase
MPTIDFHVHYTPPEMMEGTGGGLSLRYTGGVPTYLYHPALGNLDQHLATMNEAGIDLAVLSSGAGMEGGLEECRRVNERLKEAEARYPGRFAGLAHSPPLGGEPALRELERAAQELGFRGAAITMEVGGRPLDSPELWPYYERLEGLGLFLFVHPSLRPLGMEHMGDYDLARCLGREFGLATAVVRFINGGVLDRFPGLRVCFSHLGGGVATLLGRIRLYQDKAFWGTAGDERHGRLAQQPFDLYFQRLYFDTGGYGGEVRALKAALLEMAPGQLLFGSDYPQEIRDSTRLGAYLRDIRSLGLPAKDTEAILGSNAAALLGL